MILGEGWHRVTGSASASCSKLQEHMLSVACFLAAASRVSLLIIVHWEIVGWVEKRLLRDTTMCRWTGKLLDLDLPLGCAAD